MDMLDVEDVQAFEVAGVPLPAIGCVVPMQILSSPVMIGNAKMVTVAVCVHPFPLVYVMVAFPLLIPVTKPLALMVAMLASFVLQPFPLGAGSEPARLVVEFLQSDSVPVMVGRGSTDKVSDC